MGKKPVIFELDDTDAEPSVADAPPVPDMAPPAQGQAMQIAARMAARKPSRLARWFWGLLATLVGASVSLAAWNAVTALIASAPLLGLAFTVLIAAFVAVLATISLREVAALARLTRLDHLRHDARDVRSGGDLGAARGLVAALSKLYAGREDTRWARDRLSDLAQDQLDADGLLDLAEAELLAPLDASARAEIETAARQVATVTALVPLALADVVAAMTINLRMIRRIAEIYGGRSGLLGGWRLMRAVLAHLVATGAVAVGEDMLEPVLGGSLLGKLSRRFGEGLVNGALTARVGVAAMDVCRPLPFSERHRPSVRGIVRRALTGLISRT